MARMPYGLMMSNLSNYQSRNLRRAGIFLPRAVLQCRFCSLVLQWRFEMDWTSLLSWTFEICMGIMAGGFFLKKLYAQRESSLHEALSHKPFTASLHFLPVKSSKASRYLFAVSSATSSDIFTPCFPFNPFFTNHCLKYSLS